MTRSRSLASLPATSVLATAVLTTSWWMTMAGLTCAAPGEPGVWIAGAILGTAVVTVASDQRTRDYVAHLIFAIAVVVSHGEPRNTRPRWTCLRPISITACRMQIEAMGVGRPRAPGRVSAVA